MNVTKALRDWAMKHLKLKSSATDQEVRAAVTKALQDKKITAKKLEELTATKAKKSSASTLIQREVAKALAPLVKQVKDLTAKKSKTTAVKTTAKKAKKTNAKPKTEVEKAVEKAVKTAMQHSGDTSTKSPTALFNAYGKEGGEIRVKGVAERYKNTRTKAICPERTGSGGHGSKHPYAGQPAKYGNRELDHPSELDKAVSGAWFKFTLECQNDPRDVPKALRMSDEDRQLVKYALHELPFTGLIGGDGTEVGAKKVDNRKLSELERKALLDDSVSGGIEATPIVFDDAVILTPILYGELFPLVNVQNIARGRRIEGFSMGNPTFTSGTTEGAAITPFNTASFISAFDNSIYNAVASMEIGNDFEEDSPADIGGTVINQFGLKAMEWLDRVVAMGDGVVEPEGIFVTVGTTAVNSDNGVGGPATVSDYEGLMFGVVKAFRKEPGAQNCYLANEQTYRKARAIPVGSTDERRVFGMTHGDYMLLDQPYKIQVDIPNNYIGYGNFKRYRMYRRLGLTTRVETQGNYLALRNVKLIVMRMRFGGRIELSGAMSVMTDASAV